MERGQDSDGRVKAAPGIPNSGRDRYGRPVVEAGGGHSTPDGLRDELEALVVGVRSVGSEPLDRRVDETRVQLVELVPSESAPVEHSGREVLYEDVRPADEADEHLLALFGLEVEGDGALVVVEDEEVHAVRIFAVGEIDAGAVASACVFDFDNVRAQKSEHLRARRARLHVR